MLLAALLAIDEELRLDERTLEMEVATELDLALDVVLARELVAATLDAAAPPHTAPATTGTCALLPPLVPCTPNSTDEPGAIVLFQFNGAAV